MVFDEWIVRWSCFGLFLMVQFLWCKFSRASPFLSSLSLLMLLFAIFVSVPFCASCCCLLLCEMVCQWKKRLVKLLVLMKTRAMCSFSFVPVSWCRVCCPMVGVLCCPLVVHIRPSALLWHDLEMVVTWLVGLRYGMVLSWAFLYEFVCIWKTLSCPDWMKRWIGFWRALTVSKHGKEAEDGSVGLFALSCFLLWKTFPCSSEWRDRSASKHRKQKMEVICFVSLFALLFVCVWKTVSPPVHSHLKKRQID
jgi:hypothetical protein